MYLKDDPGMGDPDGQLEGGGSGLPPRLFSMMSGWSPISTSEQEREKSLGAWEKSVHKQKHAPRHTAADQLSSP